MSVIVSTKLTVDDYINFRKLCEQKGCSTYRLAKDAIQEYVMAQSDKQSAPPSKKEDKKQELEEVAEAEPTMEPGEVEARVKQILQGEVE